jgi:hypothetical protein
MIAEKLLAQEALDRHLDRDSVYQNSVDEIKKMLARDQLYREEVAGKVQITAKELENAASDARRTLFLSFVYCEKRTDAEFILKQLQHSVPFHRLEIDSSMGVMRDTVTLTWGEAEAPIELAAYRLKEKTFSPVIEASTGFYILYLENVVPDQFYTGMQPHVLRERIETVLRLRKEKDRLDEYVQETLHEKAGFALPRPFKTVARALNVVWSSCPDGSEQRLTDSVVTEVQKQCRPILFDSMVVVGRSYWSVAEVLDRLRGTKYRISRDQTTGVASQLNMQLFYFVQQELLAEEASKKKLDERWDVKKELDVWR